MQINFERVLNLTWKVKVNQPQNNRDLKQKLLNFLSKYDDSSWNVWWVITRTIKVTDTQKHTNQADENTRRLILASGKKPISQGITWHVIWNALVATLYQNYITTPWPFSIIANILLWTAPSCTLFHRQWLDPHSLCRHKDISWTQYYQSKFCYVISYHRTRCDVATLPATIQIWQFKQKKA